jgi:hypothetical protein
MTASKTAWLSMAFSSLAFLAACSGGGGGGGGTPEPPPPPPPPPSVINPTLESLLPAAPAVGADLVADAASLRPLRNGAVYAYRGTAGAAATRYLTNTTQAVGGTTSETASNAANAGARTAPVSAVTNGVVSNTRSIDFAGKGVNQNVVFTELRSPVRLNDQYQILLQRYPAADTNVDVDRDGRFDLVDVAIYARIIGREALPLPNLPTLNTVRVDTTTLRRVTQSSNGAAAPTETTTVQTWYAQGIGIVRQTTNNGTSTTDEKIVSWDGGTVGLGAMAPQAGGPLPGVNNGLRAALAFDSYGLVFSDTGTADTLISRMDTRGRIVSSVTLSGMRLGTTAKVMRAGTGVIIARQLAGADANKLGLTALNGDGVLQGAIDGVKVDLAGPRTSTTVGKVQTAVDGTQLWAVWERVNANPPVGVAPIELQVGAYSTTTGIASITETRIDNVATANQRLEASGGISRATWQRTATNETLYASTRIAPLAQKISNLDGVVSGALSPITFGSTAALVWPVGTGTAGILLDAAFNPVGSPGVTTLNGELLKDVPAFAAGAPGATGLGSRAVISGVGTGDLWAGEPNPAIIPGSVSWVDASATAALALQPAATVRFAWEAANTQMVFSDRVLVLGGATQLSTTVVWLNRGPAN